MEKLTTEENRIHDEAQARAKNHKAAEFAVIEIIQVIDQSKFFKKLGYPSLHSYVVQHMGYTQAVSGILISVARKARQIPHLQIALQKSELTASKAHKLVAAISQANAVELIAFAKTHSCRDLERKVARLTGIELSQISIDQETKDLLERVQSIACQKSRKSVSQIEALKESLTFYLDRNDPVRIAQRVLQRAAVTPREDANVPDVSRRGFARTPLKALERHKVNLRDNGRCTFVNTSGERCSEDKWLAHHHIIHVKDGGGNDPQNLTTLCWFHHDLAHQTSFDLELSGVVQEMTVRCPSKVYRVVM